MQVGRSDDPTLEDFYNDMNQHSNARYHRVDGNKVVELDSTPGGWQVTVWKAVEHPHREAYAQPRNPKNRYAWDAIGREEFEEYEEASSVFSGLDTKGLVERFCDENPYEGPRERHQDVLD